MLVRIILVVVVAAYLVGIVWAGIAALTTKGVPALPTGLLAVITVIGGGLATIFGATVGISKQQTGALLPKLPNLFITSLNIPNWDAYVWATWAYAFGMGITVVLLALIFFINPDGVPPVLSSMGSSILGVGAAVLAIGAAPPKKPCGTLQPLRRDLSVRSTDRTLASPARRSNGRQRRPSRNIRSSSRRRRLLGRPSPWTALMPGAISRTTGGGLLST
jgi:hypothetical protein